MKTAAHSTGWNTCGHGDTLNKPKHSQHKTHQAGISAICFCHRWLMWAKLLSRELLFSLVRSVKGYPSPLRCARCGNLGPRTRERDRWVFLAGYPVLSRCWAHSDLFTPLDPPPPPTHSLGSHLQHFLIAQIFLCTGVFAFTTFPAPLSHSEVSCKFSLLPFPLCSFVRTHSIHSLFVCILSV